MSLPGPTEAPLAYAAFIVWHVWAGTIGTSLIHWRRHGVFPSALLRRAPPSRHRRLQLAEGGVSLVWGAAVIAFLFWPPSHAHALGAPRIDVGPIAGWIVCVGSHVGMIAAQLDMGKRFRVTIRVGESAGPEELRTTGFLGWSRNPVYLFTGLFVVGVWLWASSIAVGATGLAILVCIRGLALEEERLLAERFGAEYDAYRARVRRWI